MAPLLARRPLRLLLLLVLTIGFVFPVFLHPTRFGGWDQTYFHAFDETARKSVIEYGQFPLWNPYHCGGRTLIGHVANCQLHPLFWFVSLPLGTAIGYKLYLLIHVFLALVGMDLYLRRRGADHVGAILGAVVFGASGYFSWHFAGGHISYLGLTLTPWLLICMDEARHKMRWGVWVGAVLASTYLMGGAYSYPFQVLLVALHSFYFAIRDRSPRIFVAAAIAAGVSLCVTGVKTLPVLEFTLRHSRTSGLLDSTPPWGILEMLISRSRSYGRWAGHHFVWPEYGAYIGYVALFLAGVAVVREPRRRAYYIGMGLLFAGLVLGNQGSFSPYVLLRKVPVFSDLRLPSRYIIFVVFYLGALAAFAVTAWRKRIARGEVLTTHPRLLRALPVLVVCLGVIEILSFSCVELFRTYNIKPVPIEKGRSYYQWYVGQPQIESYLGPFRNVGILRCYEEAANPQSKALRAGKVPQVWLHGAGGGSARRTGWSPNAVRATATLERPGLLVVNQNHDPGWRSSSGRVVNHRGLLAIRLPAGKHRLTIRYLPRSFIGGLVLSGLSLALVLLGFVLLRRREGGSWLGLLFPIKGR